MAGFSFKGSNRHPHCPGLGGTFRTRPNVRQDVIAGVVPSLSMSTERTTIRLFVGEMQVPLERKQRVDYPSE